MTPRRPSKAFDGVWALGAVAFVIAAAAAAWPAVKAGPQTLAALLLLIGLAVVTGLGLIAFRTPDTPDEEEALRVIDAFAEPAALVSPAGRILAANTAWRERVGLARRLPSGAALYGAVRGALRGRPGVASLKVVGGEREAHVHALSRQRLVVRLEPVTEAPAAAPRASAPPTPGVKELPTVLAPFGAAMLEGEDPFTAVVTEANAALLHMAGEDSPVGRAFGDLIEPASRAEVAERIAEGHDGPFEVKLAADTARIAHLYLTRADGQFMAYLVDVSEQKQMELQLKQSQKMQAIGQLAGGVAHDFNNLLTAIELRLDELLARHPVGDPSYEGLNQIRQTGARAADLVRKLLAFSRKQTVQRVTLDVGELISESEVLLSRLLPEDMRLNTIYARDLPKVRADKSQLETAVMNLVVNARDAIKAHRPGPGGVITICCARLTHEKAVELGYGDPKAGDGEVAMIEVADNGTGIPDDVREKMFEPFFTTKAVGEGTGLGLSTVYGIVKQADGWIEAANREEGGAAFRIFLPVYTPVEGAAAVDAPKPVRPTPRDLSGNGRILFVEDEDAVRGIAARLLRDRGYEVIEACDGEEALAIAEDNAGQIDLLISDVIMPGMGGPELLKQARQYLGPIPVMFISGYAESDFSDLLEGEESVTFLAKPLDIKTLAQRVKQQLQAS